MARILCNIRADGEPLSAEIRRELMNQARQEGKLTKASLEKAISSRLGKETETNVSNYFTLHPDSEEALYLNPAVEVLQRSGIGQILSPSVYRIAANRLRRGKSVTPNYLLNLLKSRGGIWRGVRKENRERTPSTGQSKESQEDRSGLCRHAVKTQICDGACAVCPHRLEKKWWKKFLMERTRRVLPGEKRIRMGN